MEIKFINLTNGAALEIVRLRLSVTFRIRANPAGPWFELGVFDCDGFHTQVQQRAVVKTICSTLNESGQQVLDHEVQIGVKPSRLVVEELRQGFSVFIGDRFIFDAHMSYASSIVPSSAVAREAKALLQELGCETDCPAPQFAPTVPEGDTQLEMARKVIGEKSQRVEELENELVTAQLDLEAEKKKVALRDATIDELKARLKSAEHQRAQLIETVNVLCDKV